MKSTSSGSTHELLLAGTPFDVETVKSLPSFRRFVGHFRRPAEVRSSAQPRFTVDFDGGSHTLRSTSAGDTIFRAGSEGDFLLLFDRFLIDKFISSLPETFLLVHAATFLNGKTVLVFPGSPGAGKTTLSEYLLSETDWTFLSDELLALDPNEGEVYPFPHPLNLKHPPSTSRVRSLEITDSGGKQFFYGLLSEDRLRNRSVSFEGLGVFELDRSKAARSSIESLSRGEGFQRLLPYALKPESTLARFRRVTALEKFDVTFHRFRYRDFSEVNFDRLKSKTA